ncbi:MAG TPA: phosphate ABC transporter substrate-binding protein PstS [Candidatus Kapabacteria bacterium]|nr:phosphate ABC transporter substrate-binding protein PstS [Candidatus Kapabacteria bacterium]
MSRFHCFVALAATMAFSVMFVACGGKGSSSGSPEAEKAAVPGSAAAINGAGATFPYPLYSRWFYEYAYVDQGVKFNYQAIGSGGGIAQITAKTVDFGASDAILTDEQLKAAPGVQMFPTVAGGIVPVYNLTGEDGKPITAALNFPYSALADIYLGKIKKWNDPVLAKANPDVKLPNKDITVVHRSDGSGTTFIFTDYLSKVSPDWKSQVGNATSVKWPLGLGGKGNEGVAGTVQQNDGAIGYVELAYALQNKQAFGAVQNKAGQFVKASPDGIQSAMSDFGSNMGDKLAISIVDGPGNASYPIAGYTYLLLYMDQTDCAKAAKVVAFVKWAYENGSKFASDLQYVPLPDAVKQQVLAKLAKITCQGKPL